jgi:hypothetical protein
VPSDEIEKVKQLLSGLGMRTIVQEAPGQSLIFRIDMYKDTERAKERVVASQYKNGTLQVQGKGALFDSVCLQLQTALLQSFAERGAQFVPDSERHALFEHMNRPQTERMALEWAYKYLGEQVFEFLEMNDRETYLSGAGLFLSIQEMKLQLPDYSIVVMPFARAYEGFIIQLAFQLGITTQETMLANAKVTKIGEYLKQIKDKIERTDKTQYGHLIDALQSAWRGVRNKVMHSDHANPHPYTQLSYAEQDIQAIHRAISLGYGYLLERGIVQQAETQEQPSKQEAEEIKGLCQYDVVPISPKAYNKLYSEIGNLNRLLAWGHARALENVLKHVSCDLAVADQFGDENFLRNALLSEGRPFPCNTGD